MDSFNIFERMDAHINLNEIIEQERRAASNRSIRTEISAIPNFDRRDVSFGNDETKEFHTLTTMRVDSHLSQMYSNNAYAANESQKMRESSSSYSLEVNYTLAADLPSIFPLDSYDRRARYETAENPVPLSFYGHLGNSSTETQSSPTESVTKEVYNHKMTNEIETDDSSASANYENPEELAQRLADMKPIYNENSQNLLIEQQDNRSQDRRSGDEQSSADQQPATEEDGEEYEEEEEEEGEEEEGDEEEDDESEDDDESEEDEDESEEEEDSEEEEEEEAEEAEESEETGLSREDFEFLLQLSESELSEILRDVPEMDVTGYERLDVELSERILQLTMEEDDPLFDEVIVIVIQLFRRKMATEAQMFEFLLTNLQFSVSVRHAYFKFLEALERLRLRGIVLPPPGKISSRTSFRIVDDETLENNEYNGYWLNPNNAISNDPPPVTATDEIANKIPRQ